MASRSEASSGSASLCDLLYNGLSARIPRLKRKELQKSCAISQEGRKPFAYVYYRKKADAVEVWCRGDVRRLNAYAGIAFRERDLPGTGWAQSFPGRFKIDSPNRIEAAVRCLTEEAYPKS